MLQDPTEVDQLPRRGIASLRDAETGEKQFVWIRKSLREKVEKSRIKHIKSVNEACRILGLRPFVVKGEFDTALMTEYFLGGGNG
jgi:hypothetical protein